jgi:hypothetical protein
MSGRLVVRGRVCGEYHLHDEEDEDGQYDDDGGNERDDVLDEKEDQYYGNGSEDEERRDFSKRTRRELCAIYVIRACYTRYLETRED